MSSIFDSIELTQVTTFDGVKWVSQVTLKVMVNGQRFVAAGEGVGPVNAIDNAIKSVGRYAGIDFLADCVVDDFKVEMSKGIGTEAIITVKIRVRRGCWHIFAEKSSANIIEASLMALLEAYSKFPGQIKGGHGHGRD